MGIDEAVTGDDRRLTQEVGGALLLAGPVAPPVFAAPGPAVPYVIPRLLAPADAPAVVEADEDPADGQADVVDPGLAGQERGLGRVRGGSRHLGRGDPIGEDERSRFERV